MKTPYTRHDLLDIELHGIRNNKQGVVSVPEDVFKELLAGYGRWQEGEKNLKATKWYPSPFKKADQNG